MGIICPPGWDRVNWSAKTRGDHSSPPPSPPNAKKTVLLSIKFEESCPHPVTHPQSGQTMTRFWTRKKRKTFKHVLFSRKINRHFGKPFRFSISQLAQICILQITFSLLYSSIEFSTIWLSQDLRMQYFYYYYLLNI